LNEVGLGFGRLYCANMGFPGFLRGLRVYTGWLGLVEVVMGLMRLDCVLGGCIGLMLVSRGLAFGLAIFLTLFIPYSAYLLSYLSSLLHLSLILSLILSISLTLLISYSVYPLSYPSPVIFYTGNAGFPC
jgi:hypothetical protein